MRCIYLLSFLSKQHFSGLFFNELHGQMPIRLYLLLLVLPQYILKLYMEVYSFSQLQFYFGWEFFFNNFIFLRCRLIIFWQNILAALPCYQINNNQSGINITENMNIEIFVIIRNWCYPCESNLRLNLF